MDAGCARGLCRLAAAVFASSGPTADAAPMTDSPSIAPLATPASHGLERLHIPLLDDAGWSQARVDLWLWGFTTLGIVLRLLVYLLRLPIWTDKAKLATSLLDRGYRGLAEPSPTARSPRFPSCGSRRQQRSPSASRSTSYVCCHCWLESRASS